MISYVTTIMLCLISTIQAAVQINEFHYDNVNVDVNQFIEFLHNESLMGYEVLLYNGANGLVYNRTDLSFIAPTTVGMKWNYTVVPFKQIANDIEGIALKDPSGKVIEFISYEGSFTARNGAAKGMTSMNIVVSESNVCTAAGLSLQKCASNGLWIGPKRSTPGKLNRNCGNLKFPQAQQMPPCVIATTPVKAPVMAPIKAPVMAPVMAPIMDPVTAPVMAPVMAPAMAPVAVPSPVAIDNMTTPNVTSTPNNITV